MATQPRPGDGKNWTDILPVGWPDSSPVNAEAVLLHAREAFGARGDHAAALRSLSDWRVIGVQADPRQGSRPVRRCSTPG